MADHPLRIRHAGGVLALDFSLSKRFYVVLDGNVASITVTNLAAVTAGRVGFRQNAAGGHTVSVAGMTAGTPAPTVATAADAFTLLQMHWTGSGTKVWAKADALEEPYARSQAIEDLVGGAAADSDTLAKLASQLVPAPTLNLAEGDTGASTTVDTLPMHDAVPAGKEGSVLVVVGGFLQSPSTYTCDGTNLLHLNATLPAHTAWSVLHAHAY